MTVLSVLSLIDMAAQGQTISKFLSAPTPIGVLSVGGLMVAFVYGAAAVLYTVRGTHHWNTESLEVSIQYLTEDGASVQSTRRQIFTPNRAEVCGIQSGVTSTGYVDPNDWHITELGGRQVDPERSVMKFQGKQAICFMCPNGASYPYPWWGLFAPRSAIAKHYSAVLDGTVQYNRSFMDPIEYFTCDPKNPVSNLIFRVDVPSNRLVDGGKNGLTVWIFRHDNSVVRREQYPLVNQPVSGVGFEIASATVPIPNLKKDEVVRFEWTLTP